MLKEFKEFALRGNVLDLAVGVIIGAAFQNLVTSLTKNIISPIIGCLGEVDFSNWSLDIGNLHLTYGAFITDIINFLIMAFIVFLLVKFMNKLANLGCTKKEPEKTTKECPYCFSEININATKCPHCISKLDIEEDNDEKEKAYYEVDEEKVEAE